MNKFKILLCLSVVALLTVMPHTVYTVYAANTDVGIMNSLENNNGNHTNNDNTKPSTSSNSTTNTTTNKEQGSTPGGITVEENKITINPNDLTGANNKVNKYETGNGPRGYRDGSYEYPYIIYKTCPVDSKFNVAFTRFQETATNGDSSVWTGSPYSLYPRTTITFDGTNWYKIHYAYKVVFTKRWDWHNVMLNTVTDYYLWEQVSGPSLPTWGTGATANSTKTGSKNNTVTFHAVGDYKIKSTPHVKEYWKKWMTYTSTATETYTNGYKEQMVSNTGKNADEPYTKEYYIKPQSWDFHIGPAQVNNPITLPPKEANAHYEMETELIK